MKTRIHISVCLAVLFIITSCAMVHKTRCTNKYVSGNRYPGHAAFMNCKDPFIAENGITPDTLVARIGKATSCYTNIDTLRLSYDFEIVPVDSLTQACKERPRVMLSNIHYLFINNRLVKYDEIIYK